jgi:hypothetical protein
MLENETYEKIEKKLNKMWNESEEVNNEFIGDIKLLKRSENYVFFLDEYHVNLSKSNNRSFIYGCEIEDYLVIIRNRIREM